MYIALFPSFSHIPPLPVPSLSPLVLFFSPCTLLLPILPLPHSFPSSSSFSFPSPLPFHPSPHFFSSLPLCVFLFLSLLLSFLYFFSSHPTFSSFPSHPTSFPLHLPDWEGYLEGNAFLWLWESRHCSGGPRQQHAIMCGVDNRGEPHPPAHHLPMQLRNTQPDELDPLL